MKILEICFKFLFPSCSQDKDWTNNSNKLSTCITDLYNQQSGINNYMIQQVSLIVEISYDYTQFFK